MTPISDASAAIDRQSAGDDPPGDSPANSSDTADPQSSTGGGLKRLLGKLAGRRETPDNGNGVPQLAADTLSGAADMPMEDHETTLIANILELRGLTAEDVMVPRVDITAVAKDISQTDLLTAIAEAGHSRLPVYRETLDDVIGIIHIKDVMAAIARNEAVDIAKLMREPMMIAPSIRALDLLMEMRKSRRQMGLVVDEFGGVDGLVTIEDLVEGIVGEIADEHDRDAPPELIERPDGTLMADARFAVEDLEERFGQILTEDERENTDTLGGLVFSIAGRVPSRGELLRHSSGIEFEIVEADLRRIKRLRLRNLPKPAAAPADR